MSQRTAGRLALAICLLNIILSSTSLVLSVLNGASLVDLFDLGPIIGVSFSVMGVLIAAHRRNNPIGWIFLAVGCSQSLVAFAYQYATYALIMQPGSLPGGPAMSWLGQLAWVPGLHLLLTYGLLLFPIGRLPSARWRIVGWLCALPLLIFVPVAIWAWSHRGRALLEHPEQFQPTGVVGMLAMSIFPLMLLCGCLSVISLGVRFRRSRGIERQQLKWVTYAAALTLGMIIIGNFLIDDTVLRNLVLVPIIPSIPIAAGVAVLRYRLYEIDRIINRTLVYGALTAVLVAVYIGSVIILQALLRPLVGTETQLATVASTLAIVALFQPVRRRIQGTIDRRFYRHKYDAQKTLEAFNKRLRDETDVDHLTHDLISVVDGTLQPAHISLWLRAPGREIGQMEVNQ